MVHWKNVPFLCLDILDELASVLAVVSVDIVLAHKPALVLQQHVDVQLKLLVLMLVLLPVLMMMFAQNDTEWARRVALMDCNKQHWIEFALADT